MSLLAKTGPDRPMLGGQAVIEGVMMRGPSLMAIAVRRPDGGISLTSRPVGGRRQGFLSWPIIRGVVSFVDSLRLGVDAIMYSANESGSEEEQLSSRDATLAVVLAFALAIGLFFILPTFLMSWLNRAMARGIVLNLVEGGLRLAIFLIYLGIISRSSDVARVLAYHGAEHKVIHCHEAGLDLTPANARGFSPCHPRCGTAFLLIVMLIAVVIYGFFGWPNPLLRIVIRLAFLPVIAGVSYEALRWLARSDSGLTRVLVQPGLFLQRFTTREPDDGMLEVAITALNAVLDAGEGASV